jgi:hypothetical protein
MDNQQETKFANHVKSRILRDYTLGINEYDLGEAGDIEDLL